MPSLLRKVPNIMQMTVKDFQQAVDDEEFGAKMMKSRRYKTSFIYGVKAIVFTKELYKQTEVSLRFTVFLSSI